MDANRGTVLISGGTGFIGGHLVRRLTERGTKVVVLTRDVRKAARLLGQNVELIRDVREILPHAPIDAVVNLAGAPILGLPWTPNRRRELLGSRIAVTNALVGLVARSNPPPRVFVSASAVGFYGIQGDRIIDEQAGPSDIFQSRLCQEWEEAAQACVSHGVRLVRLRLGVVLGRDGGALLQLARPIRLGFGAVLGTGSQWVSWIHIEDVMRLVEHVLDTPTVDGALNATSPFPVQHAQLQRQIAAVLHRPMWLRIPGPIVRTALGEMSQLLLDGQRVVPGRALAAGFEFRFPKSNDALQNLLGTHRSDAHGRS